MYKITERSITEKLKLGAIFPVFPSCSYDCLKFFCDYSLSDVMFFLS